MAVHGAISRHIYPPMNSYSAPQTGSPVSMHSSQHDVHNRSIYGHNFGFHQPVFFQQSQYALPPQAHYGAHAAPQAYPPVTSTNSGILLSQQHAVSVPQGMPPSPRLKLEQAALQRQPPSMAMSTGSSGSPVTTNPAGNASNPSAAPGPIPATTPLVVRQDQNGVQWIAFEYSRDRVKMEYTIRCDVESVAIEDLSQDFKSANCVYPRACGGKDQYKGNRLHYESECNAVGWALAELNPVLREKRGLIQRAVDSWRNSNQDPRLRSRRVRRQAKISNRKSHVSQTPSQLPGHHGSATMGSQGSGNMNAHVSQQIGVPAGQLHHHHSNSEVNMGSSGSDDVSAGNEVKASTISHHHTRPSSVSLSPTDTRPSNVHFPTYSLHSGISGANMPVLRDGLDVSTLTPASSWIKEEDEDKKAGLFGDLPEGKKRKFILVDDHARGTRVRVRVLLDGIKMEEMPDSHLRTNSVFPRSYYPRQMNSPPQTPGHPRNWDDCESDDEMTASRGQTSVPVPLLDGSHIRLAVPRMSRGRRQKELALNELGYRMSWSQAKTFNERSLFMQKSLDAYRDKMRTTMLASGQDSSAIAAHFETRVGKRKWLERRSRYRRGSS
ncbi:hypothetical protein BDV97DRAFT_304780 [Delphinella strobiligena]|nr:hypothetical protein BDV97DRAFT_304780 [Delphinella strobiligena]